MPDAACQPKLTLDLQTVNARLSKLEEQLASGAFTVKAAAKPADADDEERPPFPDDADDPFAGQPVQDAPEDAPKAEQPNATEPVGFWPELARQIQTGLSVRERSFFNPMGRSRPFCAAMCCCWRRTRNLCSAW